MNPIYEKVQVKRTQSIQVKLYQLTHFDIPYHYHPEIEVVYFKKGTGKVFVEHSMTSFEPGSLFIFGPNVPHLFVEDKTIIDQNIEILVIQFEFYVLESCLDLPEFINIKDIVEDAHSGIKFKELLSDEIPSILSDIHNEKGLERFLRLSYMFELLKLNYTYTLINKFGERIEKSNIPGRLRLVNHYILQNYNNEISLERAAKISNMNKASFCRFFKKHTRKSFGQYVNDMRIDYACKLLIEGSLNVSSICYEVGFNSVPYFIKQFKRLKGMTPKKFRQQNLVG
ncbi:AraC family transcriptional regulator [Aquimarina gracilis]|uniref:AraC family transcriptional regulator n=1 Tax=Aquimarina gracilis TaxID=874422 RepID=A0ABU5ZSN8_9FLAO|nr:AraC family transcriptional regulator [Aquimarina gracilis]MEB3345089.1 AraC family transcriptional regulator [Aquimarina gracilis]